MLEPFENYVNNGRVVKQESSPPLAQALLKRAERRYEKVKEGIDHNNPDFSFEEIYETLREIAQSFLAEKGFKPYSHEATIAYLAQEKYLQNFEIEKFDELRKKRHDIMYYGKSLKKEEAEQALDFCITIFPKLQMCMKRKLDNKM